MKYFLLIICTYLAIFPSITLAKVSSSEDYDFYYVYPHSRAELMRALNNETPISEDGEKFYGYAYSVVKWNFRWRYNKKSCWITAVDTDVNTTYTLPKLGTDVGDVDAIWNQWYPRLLFHEKGHHELAVNIAHKIDRHILLMPAEANCSVLEKKANRIGYRAISELGSLNKEYDQRTHHGETEGANLHNYL